MNEVDFSNNQKAKKEKLKRLKKEFATLFEKKNYMLSYQLAFLEALYIQKIGQKLYKVYCLKIEVQILKQRMSFLQAYVNRNETPNTNEVEQQIEILFADYQKKIEEEAQKIKEANEYLNNPSLSQKEAEEIKKLYYTIVKHLHPDVNPNPTDEQKELFLKAQTAYELLDLKTLRQIMLSIEIGTTDKITQYNYDKVITTLENNIKKLKQDIKTLKSTFPFTYSQKLKDEDWIASEQKTAQIDIDLLKAEIKKLKKYITLLEEWTPEL